MSGGVTDLFVKKVGKKLLSLGYCNIRVGFSAFASYKKQSPFFFVKKVAKLSKKSVAGSGTQSQVSRRLFCFFFLRLKKEDISYSRGRLSLQ